VIDLRKLSYADLLQTMTALGDAFWEQVDFKDALEVFTEGIAGNHLPGILISEKLLLNAVKYVQEQINKKQRDQKAMEEQAHQISRVRKTRSLLKLMDMDPKDFELWTAGYFLNQGYKDVVVVPPGPDLGVDIYMTSPQHQKAIVQCKRYKTDHIVGRPLVDQFFTVLHRFKVCYGFVVTTSDFSSDAHLVLSEYGKKYAITLLNGKGLVSRKAATQNTGTFTSAIKSEITGTKKETGKAIDHKIVQKTI
jgi:HJR/Mrr/RecB family endonuclease